MLSCYFPFQCYVVGPLRVDALDKLTSGRDNGKINAPGNHQAAGVCLPLWSTRPRVGGPSGSRGPSAALLRLGGCCKASLRGL